ncbi:hypothetical protein LguiA_032525 [Lonicera macranthoides]
MYVTRPLSHLIRFPNSLSDLPEGPNSGYLVIKDEEAETYCCFGLCKNRDLVDLPFPQNKDLTIRYWTQAGENSSVSYDDVLFIPLLNHPLSSNRYYAIKPHGSHKGEAYTCSTDEDMSTCCFCNCIKDIKPKPFNPQDLHQQYEIFLKPTLCNTKGYFYANSVAPDAYPPYFLRRKGWEISAKTPKNYQLHEAIGLNGPLRARLPEFTFPLTCQSSERVVVGKWYCPFMFIKDGALRDQMKRSMYYEMTLEQKWEQIFTRDNEYGEGNAVNVDVTIKKEMVHVGEREAMWDEKKVVGGVIWFTSFGSGGEEIRVGLSSEIVGRMKWEQERGGWVGGEERQVRVKRIEEFGGIGGWRKFGCYVLVERFVLKRMDGSVAMTYDFKHAHQVRCKWE